MEKILAVVRGTRVAAVAQATGALLGNFFFGVSKACAKYLIFLAI